MKCPGQDRRRWNAENIYDVECPVCGSTVEFFKDDITRRCPNCSWEFRNPKLDLGCAQWCPYARQCQEAVSTHSDGAGGDYSGNCLSP